MHTLRVHDRNLDSILPRPILSLLMNGFSPCLFVFRILQTHPIKSKVESQDKMSSQKREVLDPMLTFQPDRIVINPNPSPSNNVILNTQQMFLVVECLELFQKTQVHLVISTGQQIISMKGMPMILFALLTTFRICTNTFVERKPTHLCVLPSWKTNLTLTNVCALFLSTGLLRSIWSSSLFLKHFILLQISLTDTLNVKKSLDPSSN